MDKELGLYLLHRFDQCKSIRTKVRAYKTLNKYLMTNILANE